MLKPVASRKIVGVKETFLPGGKRATGCGYVIWAHEKDHHRHTWVKVLNQLNLPDRRSALSRNIDGSSWGMDTIIYTPIYEPDSNEWGKVSL